VLAHRDHRANRFPPLGTPPRDGRSRSSLSEPVAAPATRNSARLLDHRATGPARFTATVIPVDNKADANGSLVCPSRTFRFLREGDRFNRGRHYLGTDRAGSLLPGHHFTWTTHAPALTAPASFDAHATRMRRL
jgi:hypothetical protein